MVEFALWESRGDDLTVDELILLARFLARRRIDDAAHLVALDKDEYRKAWQRLSR